ncbi:MAG: hypothetical protein AB1629_01765 [Candidatus Omnitrophota bacterium]
MDCNNLSETGRMTLETSTNTLWLCTQPAPDINSSNPEVLCICGAWNWLSPFPEDASVTQFCKEKVANPNTTDTFTTVAPGGLPCTCKWDGNSWDGVGSVFVVNSIDCSQPDGWVPN